jgi:hypothetical protein
MNLSPATTSTGRQVTCTGSPRINSDIAQTNFVCGSSAISAATCGGNWNSSSTSADECNVCYGGGSKKDCSGVCFGRQIIQLYNFNILIDFDFILQKSERRWNWVLLDTRSRLCQSLPWWPHVSQYLLTLTDRSVDTTNLLSQNVVCPAKWIATMYALDKRKKIAPQLGRGDLNVAFEATSIVKVT